MDGVELADSLGEALDEALDAALDELEDDPEPLPEAPPPDVVELLVAATWAGGALEAAAKMKLGVGTNRGAAPGRTCTVCPGREITVTSSPAAVRAVTLCAPLMVWFTVPSSPRCARMFPEPRMPTVAKGVLVTMS